jgi:uncharacterized membrane protein
MRKLLSIMALFVVSLLTFSMVSALTPGVELDVDSVKVNGDEVDFMNNEVLSVEEGQTLEIKVGLKAPLLGGAEDVEVEAKISGYEYSDYDDLEDSTHLFDIAEDTTKYVNLEVTLPKKLEKDTYWLRLRVMDKNTDAITYEVKLAVEPTRHGIEIADVVLSPGTTLKAGRSLLATVLLENFGDNTEKDVKVTVAVPELGVSATEFVDVVSTDNGNVDYEDVPEMFLPIPETAAEGDYEVKVTVKYDDLRETVTKSTTLHVLADKAYQSQEDLLVLAVGPDSQTLAAGSTGSYAVALSNPGATSKAYVLEAAAGDWAAVSLSDMLVVLEPGENQVVYMDVAVASDATVGEHLASLTVKSGSEVLETVVLKANVAGKSSAAQDSVSLRNGLEIALVVLVVLLVILGLVIGFSRLRKDEDGEEQTYY